MKMIVDVSKLEEAFKKNLRSSPSDEVFLYGPSDCPGEGTITCGIMLKELEEETSFAREMVTTLAEASLRIWALRGGKI